MVTKSIIIEKENMADFEKHYLKDITIINVNLTRATLREAREFKNLLLSEIDKRKIRIVIDLSQCEFMDSTFVGVLVITLKMVSDLGGELRLVEPSSIAHSILMATGTLNIFNICQTLEEAISELNLVKTN